MVHNLDLTRIHVVSPQFYTLSTFKELDKLQLHEYEMIMLGNKTTALLQIQHNSENQLNYSFG